MSPPPLYSANDYGIETICYTPKLVKSLMHRKVIKISSGGVHNICIVESQPACVFKDVYQCFMQDKFTDVVFKGFYTTHDEEAKQESNAVNRQRHGAQINQSNNNNSASSDEEMKSNEG